MYISSSPTNGASVIWTILFPYSFDNFKHLGSVGGRLSSTQWVVSKRGSLFTAHLSLIQFLHCLDTSLCLRWSPFVPCAVASMQVFNKVPSSWVSEGKFGQLCCLNASYSQKNCCKLQLLHADVYSHLYVVYEDIIRFSSPCLGVRGHRSSLLTEELWRV